jgi:hypothetical protein
MLREGVATTTISVDIDLESPEECRQLSARILRALVVDNLKPDFKAQHIPPCQRDPSVHDTLTRMMIGRNNTEARLTAMYENQDDTTTGWEEDVDETKYDRLNTRYNNYNRAMFTIYAQFLIADLQPHVPPTIGALAVTTDGA